jgi:hypothetical protein
MSAAQSQVLLEDFMTLATARGYFKPLLDPSIFEAANQRLQLVFVERPSAPAAIPPSQSATDRKAGIGVWPQQKASK